ncbi:MAG: 50S ribosomal protein L6 [Gemmatimonadetes bacterium]|nr:50S ribosomal protein L6 [Gemmatimonadota bacterium]
MSRIGKRPLPLPQGVTATVDGQRVSVKGPKGELSRTVHSELKVRVDDGQLIVERPSDEAKHKALHGLTRTLLKNMVEGVMQGYTRSLEIQGVGYKAEVRPPGVRLLVGFSHPVDFKAPAGIKLSVENNVLLKVEGIDKELVGQVAAEIRKVRPPEPYKGKGILYVGEYVRRKAGKTAAAKTE